MINSRKCAQQEPWPTFTDLVKAYKECRIGKPASLHQCRFETVLGENLVQLHREIHVQKYKPSRATAFVVTHPKPREIFASHFRDRIVHHLIVSNLQPIWEPKFSHFSFACRKGRGTHGALKEMQKQVRKISQGGRKTVYVLQLDFASFFVSIQKPILRQLFLKHLKSNDHLLKQLICIFMDYDPRKNVVLQSPKELMALIPSEKSWFNRAPHEGIPIGNLTSQFGANVYLNDLDHWIVRHLKPMGYIRYMDDLTLFHRDQEALKTMIGPIDDWIKQNRHQELNHSKTTLKSLKSGIDYLGYKIIQSTDQKQPARILATRKRKWDFVQDIRRLEHFKLPKGRLLHPLAPAKNFKTARLRLASVNSRLGLLKHSDSYAFKKVAINRLIQSTNKQWVTLDESGANFRNVPYLRTKDDFSALRLP